MGKDKHYIKRNIHVPLGIKRELGPCDLNKVLDYQSLAVFGVEMMFILMKAEMWAGKVMALRPSNL